MLPTIATGNVASALAGEYEVDNSLRFDDGSSDFLHRMKSNSDEITTMTFSCWVKRCSFGSTQRIFSHMTASFVNYFYFRFESDDKLAFASENTGGYDTNYKTNRVFRDSSAWYHLVARIDTTASGGNRIRIYVNGEQETSLSASTEPDQNSTFSIGTTSDPMVIGGLYGSGYGIGSGSSTEHFDGYIAEAVMCEGQSLDPTSFGEFDSDTGIWKPIDVSGLTFGTNGFYLDFENSGSLGADVSGNGNNFTVNNLTSIDQTTDTCTNNFATMNPLANYLQQSTFSEGNNKMVTATSPYSYNVATMGISSGKWYWEIKYVSANENLAHIGVSGKGETISSTNPLGNNSTDYGFSPDAGGRLYKEGTFVSDSKYIYSIGDIIGIAIDMDSATKTLKLYQNGTLKSTDTISSTPESGFYFPALGHAYSVGQATFETNFGNPTFTISSGNSDGNGYGNFEYSVPSGYYALNTKNLAEYG